MRKTAKTVLILAAAAIIIFALAAIACDMFYPKYNITRGYVTSPNRPDYSGQHISVWHDPGYVPENSRRAQNASEIQNWIFAVSDELRLYTAPYNVAVSGEVSDGKTTLRYEGVVTTQEGETINYLNEKTFDFVLDKDLFSQKSALVPVPYISVIFAAVAFVLIGAAIIILFVKRKKIFNTMKKQSA